jgi:hypothetical protein
MLFHGHDSTAMRSAAPSRDAATAIAPFLHILMIFVSARCGTVLSGSKISLMLSLQFCGADTGNIMRDFFPFTHWKAGAIFSACTLVLGLAGTVQAQPAGKTDRNDNAPAAAKGKAGGYKGDKGKKEKKAEKKSPKQTEGDNPADYHGAQPPQGGRLGQGPD